MKYYVKQILEPDFGCEGRPENYVAVDQVLLMDSDGQEMTVEIPDTELYEKNINVGDWVCFDGDLPWT